MGSEHPFTLHISPHDDTWERDLDSGWSGFKLLHRESWHAPEREGKFNSTRKTDE